MAGGNEAQAEVVTLKEAAEELHSSPARLRRILSRPEWERYAQRKTRDTATGKRTATLIPRSVIPALANLIQEENENGTKRGPQPKVKETGTELVQWQTRLIDEQAARIADLQAQIEDLKQSRDAALQLAAREQALRSLPPPAPPQPEAEQKQEGGRKRSWWPFGKRE